MNNEENNLESSDNNIKTNISNFYLLFTNMKESNRLLKTYKKFIDEYSQTINGYYKQLTELHCHFLIEDKFKSSVINTPIFQLGKAIKKAVGSQINRLFSIITDSKIFEAFNNSLSNLENILQESSIKFDKKFFGKNIRPIASSLMETYAEIESKVVDNYISKKYNKHLMITNNEPLQTNIEQAKYLEKTFLDFEEGSKIKFFNDLKEMENKAIEVFNEMKSTVGYIIITLKNTGNEYLDLLQKEIDSIWKIDLKVNEKNDNKSDTKEEINLKNNYDLNNFKYKIKIIENPNVRVEEEENDIGIRKRTEEILFEDNEITLKDEDIYDIVYTLYNYDFKLLNKTDYNLDIEKEKIKVIKLTEKLLSFDTSNSIDENITDEEVNMLYELLNNIDNLVKFYVILNNHRATGKYSMTERAFNIIKNIFYKALDYLSKNNQKKIEEFTIILSQTFYMIKDKKKIYLQEGIKDHHLFKNKEFWEHHLNEIINDELKKLEKNEKDGKIILSKQFKNNKIKEIIVTKLVPLSNYMSDFGVPKEMILSVINPIMDKYNLDENSRILSLTILNQK